MAFIYKLENDDGTPADSTHVSQPPGNALERRRHDPASPRTGSQVLSHRPDENLDGDPVPVLIVEPS